MYLQIFIYVAFFFSSLKHRLSKTALPLQKQKPTLDLEQVKVQNHYPDVNNKIYEIQLEREMNNSENCPPALGQSFIITPTSPRYLQ